ncbi:MAG TPA: NHL repeat-containing protein [Acidobacteriaceae bacterium]
MTRLRSWLMGLILVCFFPALAIAQGAPQWKVDPAWPKPLPNNWMVGHPDKIVVDKDGNIWLGDYVSALDRRNDHVQLGLQQTPPIAECCVPIPGVVEFDPQGNVLRAWGGPGYVPEWPEAPRAFWVDKHLNVWIGGNHGPDRNLLKFSADGKLLMEIGHLAGPIGVFASNRANLATPNNQATDLLGGPCGVFVDEDANEVYIVDGGINKRVVVYDSNTGKFKRGWGAYGIPLSQIDNHKLPGNEPGVHESENYDPAVKLPKQFTSAWCIRISNDGLVYITDTASHRIQVFTKEGRFVKEIVLTRPPGVTYRPGDFTFSRDPEQKYLIVVDDTNHIVRILNRKDGSQVSTLGSRGRNAGQFEPELFAIDLDAKGNLYISETKYGLRIQKFVPEGTSVSSFFYPVQTTAPGEVPKFKVDSAWPGDMPFTWSMGMINGLAVGPDDHVWVIHDPRSLPSDEKAAAQNPAAFECCLPAPEVLEFDQTGKVLRAWSGRERVSTWPLAAHGISVDKKGNVWIGGVGKPWAPDLPGFTLSTDATGAPLKLDALMRDRQVLKFAPDGKLLLQIGQPSLAAPNNKDTSMLGAPTAVAFDDAANEVYIADGLMNKRVVVYDMNTGEFKRGWGAYGISLGEIDNSDPSAKELPTGRLKDASVAPPKQFRTVTGIAISDDGMVYVTDQMNNRVQAFTKEGKFVKEMFVAPKTGGNGSAWGLAISRDAKQRFLYIADGNSGVIRILDRQTGADLGKLGSKGRNAGQLSNPAFVAFDSKGDLYTGEVNFPRSWDGAQASATGMPQTGGGRLQRFVPEK